jgi:hypothetical protein
LTYAGVQSGAWEAAFSEASAWGAVAALVLVPFSHAPDAARSAQHAPMRWDVAPTQVAPVQLLFYYVHHTATQVFVYALQR